jgi:hypothetical protein
VNQRRDQYDLVNNTERRGPREEDEESKTWIKRQSVVSTKVASGNSPGTVTCTRPVPPPTNDCEILSCPNDTELDDSCEEKSFQVRRKRDRGVPVECWTVSFGGQEMATVAVWHVWTWLLGWAWWLEDRRAGPSSAWQISVFFSHYSPQSMVNLL